MATPATREARLNRPESPRPTALRLAAAAQGAEALGMLGVTVVAAVITADGHNYKLSSDIGLTVFVLAVAAGLAAFAVGLYQAKSWTRTPVVMTQVFVGAAGFYLISGHHYRLWGILALLLAIGVLAGLFTPASVRALNRPPFEPEPAAAPPANTGPARPAKAQSPKPQQPKPQQPKPQQPQAQQPQAQQPKSKSVKPRPAPQGSGAKGRPAKKPAR